LFLTHFHHLFTKGDTMTDQDNNDLLPTSTPPPTDSDPIPFTRQAMMQFLQFPDSFGVAHSFYQFDKELQRMLRSLAPWQLSLLGFHVAISRRWNDETLRLSQEDATLKLIPEALRPLVKDLCFFGPEDVPDAQVVDFPMDAWCWLFRHDPFKPRQHDVPSGWASSAESATLSPEHPEVADEEPEPSQNGQQNNKPSGRALSAEPAMLSPERLSVIDEESEPSSQNSQ